MISYGGSMGIIQGFFKDATDWCKGRNWWIRLPFLIFFGYVLIQHLKNPLYKSILGVLNLAFHEMGHLVFMPFGKFLYFLGGSLFQCFIPFVGMWNFLYRSKDYFAFALCWGWLSTNFFEVATYMGDAREQSLPLVGFGVEPPMHDWRYLMGVMKALDHCKDYANVVRFLGVASMFVCFLLGGWMLWVMMTQKKDESVIDGRF